MHLQRIQVPDFRVLKDVDITFEKEFVPSIFPIGSLNGDGKSTLLQLIFVLLHCSFNRDKNVFLQNMINGFKIYKNSDNRVLAKIEIWDRQKVIKLVFFVYKDSYIRDLLIKNGKAEVNNHNSIKFSSPTELEEIKKKILNYENLIYTLGRSLNKLEMLKKIENDEERYSRLRREIINLRESGLRIPTTRLASRISLEDTQEATQEELEIYKINLEKLYDEQKQLELISQKVFKYLQSENLVYLCNYSASGNEVKEEVLLCQIENVDMTEAESFLKNLSKKVFLAAPATQVFLFLSQESKKLLFRDQGDENNDYYSKIKAAKSKLTSFFT